MDGKTICSNRIATHEYFILDRIEAGIVLDGGEIKSLRAGNVNLKDSFCMAYGGELFIKNMHIATYDKAGAFNVRDSKRDRKLLVHKEELVKLNQKVQQKGLTLVPLRLYFKQALVKVELGLCKGKETHDKRESIKRREEDRKIDRIKKEYNVR